MHTVEDNDAHGEKHGAEGRAVRQCTPGERSGAEDAVLEGLKDGRHGIGEHDGPHLVTRDRAEGVDDGRRVHPELDEEAEKVSEVAVLRREGAEEDAEAEAEAGEQDNQDGQQEDVGVGVDRGVGAEKVVGEDRHEEQHLDGESHEVAGDGGEGDDESREVDLTEEVGVGAEGVAGLVEAVGEVLPEADAGEIEEGLGKTVGGDAGDAAEDDHVHDRGKNGLDEEPEGTEDGLLIDGDDVARHEHPEELPVLPDFPEVDVKQALLRADFKRPGGILRGTINKCVCVIKIAHISLTLPGSRDFMRDLQHGKVQFYRRLC